MSYKHKLNHIDTLIFDVDGVLTDGTVIIDNNGDMLRNMNIKDGYAIKSAVNAGFNVCIISGGKNEGVRKRLEGLGVQRIYLGAHNKMEQFNAYCKEFNIDTEKVIYMGDDIPDIPVMRAVGLAIAPQDAAVEVKDSADYISPKGGGKGCVREVIEQVMRVQEKWAIEYSTKGDY